MIDDHPVDEFGWSGIRDWTFIWSASLEKHQSSTWKNEMDAELFYLRWTPRDGRKLLHHLIKLRVRLTPNILIPILSSP
jgi:hypothetical protein